MHMLDLVVWSSFLAFVLGLLALDLGIFHRETRAIRTGEALAWAGFYVGLALAFNVLVFFLYDAQLAGRRRERRPSARREHRRDPVPDRLPARAEPLARQRLHHRADLLVLPRAARVSAPRALLGNPRCARDARRDDRPRRRADRPLRLDHLRLRRDPDRHGRTHVAGWTRGSGSREEPGDPSRAPHLPGDTRTPRRALLRRVQRTARGDAALPRAADGRILGRALRGRLDPGDLRGDAGSVPGVHLERLRDPRACAISTSRSLRCWAASST